MSIVGAETDRKLHNIWTSPNGRNYPVEDSDPTGIGALRRAKRYEVPG
jgi:hypothetical protein